MHSSGHCFVQNLKFILNEPPRLETKNGKPIELPEFQVTTINVNFYTGIYKSRLNSMLSDMVIMNFFNKWMKSFHFFPVKFWTLHTSLESFPKHWFNRMKMMTTTQTYSKLSCYHLAALDSVGQAERYLRQSKAVQIQAIQRKEAQSDELLRRSPIRWNQI